MTVPDELARALADRPAAAAAYAALPPSHQREYCDYVSQAKRPETRARRADKATDMLLRAATARQPERRGRR